jgi:hypothetical protein
MRRGEAATVGDFGGENGYMRRILEGNEINGRELPFLSPTPRTRSLFRAFWFRPESPSTPRKAGMAWARRMDENPNPNENEEPETQLDRIPPSGCKKTAAEGLVRGGWRCSNVQKDRCHHNVCIASYSRFGVVGAAVRMVRWSSSSW